MSKSQRNDNGTRHDDSRLKGIWSVEISTNVEWVDKENKIYDEVYFRTKWLLGVCVYDRKFIAKHNIENTDNKIGFRK